MTKAAPVDDKLLEPYLKMKKFGLDAGCAMHKATQDGKLDANGMNALRAALGLKPATPIKPKEEPVDESKLFAAKKKKKVGVPLEKIMATVTGEGCNHATLVAIARAIINRPSLLLADEPTGALDSSTTAEVLELFDELHQQGITLVMVTHEDDVAARAQRIARFQDGRALTGCPQ